MTPALVGVLALSGCSRAGERAAEGPASALGPFELAARPAAAAPVTPAEDGRPVALGLGRGVDLCIFNKRDSAITVALAGSPGTQGNPQVAPGDWYCGYDFNDPVQGRIFGLPGEIAMFYAENPGLGWPDISVDLLRESDDVRFCGIFNSFKAGESDVTDSGDARYVFGRNADDSDWKYMYITVLPSQGATPECVGKKNP